ncbi:hypothetical protein AAHE18_19G177400 [Arachis hypogaea]
MQFVDKVFAEYFSSKAFLSESRVFISVTSHRTLFAKHDLIVFHALTISSSFFSGDNADDSFSLPSNAVSEPCRTNNGCTFSFHKLKSFDPSYFSTLNLDSTILDSKSNNTDVINNITNHKQIQIFNIYHSMNFTPTTIDTYHLKNFELCLFDGVLWLEVGSIYTSQSSPRLMGAIIALT